VYKFNFKIYTLISLGLVAFWYIAANGQAPIFQLNFPLTEVKSKIGLSKPSTLVINEQKIKATVVVAPKKETRGFADYERLSKEASLLYIFDKPDFYFFEREKFSSPPDIVWIGYYHNIIDIAANLAAQTSPKILEPKKPAKYILILPAGATEKLRLEIGDEVLGL
jgi:uncharacterized membrane protein (UPF0127 family)